MCLAVPMKLIEIQADGLGTAELEGVRTKVNLSLLEEVQVGEYVIIHAGFAIEKLDEAEALKTLDLLNELER
jgi:hydrogenase expression/formation protein HypC